ncbi:MAG TPA: methionine biosynthesis protein MetW [Victivallales bacterium]|nr:methionine biosynthesis protein MetW [Victivallales bacterium]HRR06229.1 methionine biosynthesis protein MetW [Victivallales bacterium]HRR27747.1 methionine biosynthesis protein MetW [Victivallales bacterium]
MKKLLTKELINRPDLIVIFDLIEEGSRVIDLGCGEGILLYHLKKQKNCSVCGVEISQDKIIECITRGIPVIHGNLDNGLNDYPENSFDCVILSQTLQAVARPDKLLKDMMRVSKKSYISLINIGYIGARVQIAFAGKMPITKSLPTPWYKTKNIHLSTIIDFEILCYELGFKIEKRIPISQYTFLSKLMPNLFSEMCVFVISK